MPAAGPAPALGTLAPAGDTSPGSQHGSGTGWCTLGLLQKVAMAIHRHWLAGKRGFPGDVALLFKGCFQRGCTVAASLHAGGQLFSPRSDTKHCRKCTLLGNVATSQVCLGRCVIYGVLTYVSAFNFLPSHLPSFFLFPLLPLVFPIPRWPGMSPACSVTFPNCPHFTSQVPLTPPLHWDPLPATLLVYAH